MKKLTCLTIALLTSFGLYAQVVEDVFHLRLTNNDSVMYRVKKITEINFGKQLLPGADGDSIDTDIMNVLTSDGKTTTHLVKEISDAYFDQQEFEVEPETYDTVYNKVAVKVTTNLRYREGDSQSWFLDMAMPKKAATSNRPAIIIFHSGKWFNGDKSDAAPTDMMLHYASLGYVAFNVNYRLIREKTFPACIIDAKSAVRWIKANATKYKVNQKMIGAYGHGAGSHLALMLALSAGESQFEEGDNLKFTSDITCAATASPRAEYGTAGAIANKKELWPINYVKANAKPILLLQGASDQVAKASLTQNFYNNMRNVGNRNIDYLEMKGTDAIAVTTQKDICQVATDAFFDKHLSRNYATTHVHRVKLRDQGGSGKYLSAAFTEKGMEGYSIIRPVNLESAVKSEGRKLPVLVYGNGACSGSGWGYERMLFYFASNGYICVEIGEMEMDDSDRDDGGSNEGQMRDALNWFATQSATKTSPYYNLVDANNMCTSGHSCGGAQAIANCGNTHVKTVVICNAGMGGENGLWMGGAGPQTLKELRGPILYMTGGPDDVAYGNAEGDYNWISWKPCVRAVLRSAGHGGTYWDPDGGQFGHLMLKWMDWQMKGKDASSIFIDGKLGEFNQWEIQHKNF